MGKDSRSNTSIFCHTAGEPHQVKEAIEGDIQMSCPMQDNQQIRVVNRGCFNKPVAVFQLHAETCPFVDAESVCFVDARHGGQLLVEPPMGSRCCLQCTNRRALNELSRKEKPAK